MRSLGNRLPLEIWHTILGLLPLADKRTCLFVSRFFHAIALRLLFATVTINLGAWENTQLSPRHWQREVCQTREALAEYRSSMAWEKLRHIRLCPHFAGTVRKLIVNAYSPGDTVFVRSCLIETLATLPNLCALVWRGKSPKLSTDVIETLAAKCPYLEELSAPRYAKCLPLSSLRSLRILSLVWQDQMFSDHFVSYESTPENDDEEFEDYDDVTEAVRSVLGSNSRTLRELALSGPWIWDSPMHIFGDLTHLDLLDAVGWGVDDPASWGNLKLIFHHSTRLESLSIVNHSIMIEPLYKVFQSELSALPYLTSFKVIDRHDEPSQARVFALSEFIRHKPRLRRLDVHIDVDWEDISPLLSVLPNLHSLEVLGITVKNQMFNFNNLELEQSIPRGIAALRLDLSYRGLSFPIVDDWLTLIKERLHLSFFYTTNAYGSGGFLNVEHLLTDAGSLELVGANGHMAYVKDLGDENTYSGEWSKRRLCFRDIEDFRHKDWEWLLRHHQLC
ncbi:hypothetical protein OBBRIDRAFT_889361 [Obba rivulosa]|uniref:F-box domain-containing protein n=1 Tax=Obba rivulosa TaxID=1052685 RepID=A0A8E2AWR8_9APHY|nr:hypothetical protein OBBRIDRAFT_889361 [Obba rivulosa]